jgi:hypothetical protein
MRIFTLVSLCFLAGAERAEACVAMPPASLDRAPTAATSRVLFELEPEGFITQTMDVAYDGVPHEFSWLIPVPAAGGSVEVSVAPAGSLAMLDSWTRLIFERSCLNKQRRRNNSFACASDLAVVGTIDPGFQNPVQVIDEGIAGPYAFTVLESDDADALMTWLDDNEIILSQAVDPIIRAVIERGGGSWVAVKISNRDSIDRAGGAQLRPLSIRFPGRVPSLAMQLSAVSMQPEMTQLVFIAAEGRYQAAGWKNIELNAEQLYDERPGFHYAAWLSKAIDDAGGEAFITEFSAPFAPFQHFRGFQAFDEQAGNPLEFLHELSSRRKTITRLISRVSPWEVTTNPSFVLSDGGDLNVTGSLDLSPHRANCGAPVQPSCGDVYCGKGASCALDTEGRFGCLCAAGEAAQKIAHPFSPEDKETVCRPIAPELNMIPEVLFDAQNDDCNCAGGDCSFYSGARVCICPEGQAAFPSAQGFTCAVPAETVDSSIVFNDHSNDGTPEFGSGNTSGCNIAAGGIAELSLLFLAGFALRRRRRSV